MAEKENRLITNTPMKVTPKTEKEIHELNLLPKGTYPFEINSAEEKVSKKGNEMIELNLKVYHGDGFRFVKDFLMDTDFGAAKLRHCADVCGVIGAYDDGGIDASDLEGREGFVKIGIKQDKEGKFPDQNVVYDYLSEAPKEESQPAPKGSFVAPKDTDDDIPF